MYGKSYRRFNRSGRYSVSRKKFSRPRYARYTKSRRPIAHKYFGKRRW